MNAPLRAVPATAITPDDIALASESEDDTEVSAVRPAPFSVGSIARHWVAIAGFLLVGLAVPGIGTLFIQPTYESDLSFYVGSGTVTPDDLSQAGDHALAMVPTFLELVDSTAMAERLKEHLGLTTALDDIRNSIRASANDNSAVFGVAVRDHDPATSQRVAAEIATEFPALLSQLDSQSGTAEKITLLSPARLDPTPVAPHRVRWIMIGAGAGLVLGLLYARFIATLLTTVSDFSELATAIRAPVLGRISSGASPAELQAELEIVRLALRDIDTPGLRSVALVTADRRGVPDAVSNALATMGDGADHVRLVSFEPAEQSTDLVYYLLSGQVAHVRDGLLIIDPGGADRHLRVSLGRACDGVLLVATAGFSRVFDLVRLRHDLDSAGASVIGGLLYRSAG
jgi:capsular polysaccharide biosynthesis protein